MGIVKIPPTEAISSPTGFSFIVAPVDVVPDQLTLKFGLPEVAVTRTEPFPLLQAGCVATAVDAQELHEAGAVYG